MNRSHPSLECCRITKKEKDIHFTTQLCFTNIYIIPSSANGKKFQVIINGQLPFSFSEQLTRLKRTITKMFQRISQLQNKRNKQ